MGGGGEGLLNNKCFEKGLPKNTDNFVITRYQVRVPHRLLSK